MIYDLRLMICDVEAEGRNAAMRAPGIADFRNATGQPASTCARAVGWRIATALRGHAPSCETKPISGCWLGVQYLTFHCSIIPAFQLQADRAKQSHFPATPGGRRNSQFVVGDGVFARKTQNTVLAYAVFWYSGILGWRPEKRGSEAQTCSDAAGPACRPQPNPHNTTAALALPV